MSLTFPYGLSQHHDTMRPLVRFSLVSASTHKNLASETHLHKQRMDFI